MISQRIFHRPLRPAALALALAALAVLPAQPTAQAQEAIVDGVAAVVNGDIITLSDVTVQVAPREMQIREDPRIPPQDKERLIQEIRLATLNDLIDRRLIVQDFNKQGFAIPDYIVEDRIKSIIRDDFAGDRNKFVETLNAQGLTIKKFRELEFEKIVVAAMRTKNVKRSSVISPQRVEEYYKANRGEEFTTPAQMRLRMISIDRTTGDPGSTAATQKIVAQEILAKIKGGAEFGRMARMYSNDTMAEFDGDYGWIDPKTLNEDLSKLAFNLKAGEVSDVIELGSSYYILYAEEKKPAVTASLDTVRDDIRKKLEEEERQVHERRWLDGLRAKSYIKLY